MAISKSSERIILVVMDGTPEASVAIRYASRCAMSSGACVAVLYVVEPEEIGGGCVQLWPRIEGTIRDDGQRVAEIALAAASEQIKNIGSKSPVTYVRQGGCTQQLLKLLTEEKRISVVVLAASSGENPLITAVTQAITSLKVPVTIISGTLKNDEIDALA